jgi:hypothetical protein
MLRVTDEVTPDLPTAEGSPVIRTACTLLVAACAAFFTPLLHAQDAPPVARHHVIFLLDQSGSVLGDAQKAAELRAVLRGELGAVLADSARNGFNTVVYDPARDLSSALAFGLYPESPLFAPEAGDSGLFRVLWTQQPARTAADLADALPTRSTHWTAYTAAFDLAIARLRLDAERQGDAAHAFERTFVVMVTDGEANAPVGVADEMRGIHEAAEDFGRSPASLRPDRESALAAVARLRRYYWLQSPDGGPGAGGVRVGRTGRLKVFVRELRPYVLTGAEALLRQRPERDVEMARGPRGVYTARLPFLAGAAGAGDEVRYELRGIDFRAPGERAYRRLPVSSTGLTWVEVRLPRDAIGQARADVLLTFVRRDPAYGRAVQRFPMTLRFHPEPDRRVMGVLPVPDWMIVPGLSQGRMVDGLNVAFVLALLAVLWVALFPAPRLGVELVGGVAGAGEPLVVDFSRPGARDDAAVLLTTLRFVNRARRGPLPRVAERHFDVRAEVELALPREVDVAPPVVGLSARMEPVRVLRKASHGTEQGVLLRPAALRDFSGDPGEPVSATLTVRAYQLPAGPFRRWRGSRRAGELRRELHVRFVAQAPEVEAALQGAAVVEHHRGADEDLAPPLHLAVRSASRLACSLARTARVQARLYRADRSGGPIAGAVEIGEPVAAEGGPRLAWRHPAGGERHARLEGIRARADGAWAARIPLWLNFEALPLPPVQGDRYVVEVALFAEDDEGWPTATARHEVRVDPDTRRPELLFMVSTAPAADDPEWRVFDRGIDGSELEVEVPHPLRWNAVGRDGTVDFVGFRVDNVARSGPGRVTLALLPTAAVEREGDALLEPDYAGGRADLVGLRWGGHRPRLGDLSGETHWSVRSDQPRGERPVELFLAFREEAIRRFNPAIRRFPYACRLPFRCTVEREGETVSYEFTVRVRFQVERYTGEHVLAVDFGTSAVVAAFAGTMDEATLRTARGEPAALLDLQRQYATAVLDARAAGEEDAASRKDEAEVPNREVGTRFIPSQLVWRRQQRVGEPGFVDLPATLGRVGREFGRAVFYLKGLILEGRSELPDIHQYTDEGREWLDESGQPRRDKSPPVEGVARSAYRNLVHEYVEPLLGERTAYLDRVVFTYPNNFHVHHLDQLRDILGAAFGERFDLHLLSESNAVALYCSYPPERFVPDALSGDRRRTFLVYDIGAGTLDLTCTALQWGPESEAFRLQEMEVLFKSGVPSGGNRLDIALARVLDGKLRHLETRAAQLGATFRYTGTIVDPAPEAVDVYPRRMLPVKLAIMEFKEELSRVAGGGGPFTVHVPVETRGTQAIVQIDLQVARAREELERLDVGVSDDNPAKALIPLTSQEIFGHKEVEAWLRSVTDEPIADLAQALDGEGARPQIDCLVLSGRTSQFPPVRERLLAALKQHLGATPSRMREARLGATERKAAVGLGALYYGLIHRHVYLVDRSLWARYGVVYPTSRGPRFQEYFSHATRPEPERGDQVVVQHGVTHLRLSRKHEITHLGSSATVVVTYSRDPDADLQIPGAMENGRLMKVKTLGSDTLGSGHKALITLAIDENDRLQIVVEADGRRHELDARPVPGNAPAPPQWAWPFTPLDGLEPPPPPGKIDFTAITPSTVPAVPAHTPPTPPAVHAPPSPDALRALPPVRTLPAPADPFPEPPGT